MALSSHSQLLKLLASFLLINVSVLTVGFFTLSVHADQLVPNLPELNLLTPECSKTCLSKFCEVPPLLRYGKYCGVRYSGCAGENPCDDLDYCCMQHDNCIGAAHKSSVEKDSMGSTTTITTTAPASNVFVYGSLLSDDVVRTLLGRVPSSSPAILPNYHRFSIKGRVYPAIIPVESKNVCGKVLVGLTPPELHILDLFEDEEYERTAIHVVLKDSSEKLQAHTYVWVNKTDPNLYGEWDFEAWKPLHLESFLNMTKGFMEEIQISDSKTRVAMYESFYQEKDINLPIL